jgi:hypothetical protein
VGGFLTSTQLPEFLSLPIKTWNVNGTSVGCYDTGGEDRILDYMEGDHNRLTSPEKT